MKIGILTGGGDCPGVNAVIRAVVRSAARRGWESVGLIGGYEGLLPDYKLPPRELDVRAVAGLLSRGGTILGTANSGQFATKVENGKIRQLPKDLLDRTKRGMKRLGLEALVAIGGDGTLSAAAQMHKHGIPIVGVPKTIDNDLDGTQMTFGFDSAVDCATDALDRLHTTAESHNRVGVLEVMGRHAGWIALQSGVAGGADVVLMPEIPFTYESICAKIAEREGQGRRFTIVVVAEGACEKVTPETRPKAKRTAATAASPSEISPPKPSEKRLGGVMGPLVTAELEQRTRKEARCCVLGHLQRGGGPTSFDRALCSIYGAEAVERVAARDFGKMVAYQGANVTAIPLKDAVGKLKTVPLNGGLIRTARALGICLGD